MFLTSKEIDTLTGIRGGRNINGRTVSKLELQINWLRSSGIPFYVNARGCPVVIKDNLCHTTAVKDPPKPSWQPRVFKTA